MMLKYSRDVSAGVKAAALLAVGAAGPCPVYPSYLLRDLAGQVGGYRDLMLCCILEASCGLKIIGEIQVLLSTLAVHR
jgi:hypothetical protein